MKESKVIFKERQKLREKIKAQEAELTALLYKEEKADAVANKDHELYLEYIKKAKENEEKAFALSDKILENKVLYNVLTDNYRAAFASEFIALFTKEIKAFYGKQYGKATKEKLNNIMYENCFSFYFSNYGYCGDVKANYITVNALRPRKYDGCLSADYDLKVDLYGVTEDNKTALFINEENTICPVFEIRGHILRKYAENPRARAKEIVKEYKAFKKAEKIRREAYEKMRDILPDKIAAPDYATEYHFNPQV